MRSEYIYEPFKSEVRLTNLVGHTLARGYYTRFVRGLGIQDGESVLDYCCGSAIIARMMAERVGHGELVAADVSTVWLRVAQRRLRCLDQAQVYHITDFQKPILQGSYDKIVLHYVLHDFPDDYRLKVAHHGVSNLGPSGALYIREPLSSPDLAVVSIRKYPRIHGLFGL